MHLRLLEPAKLWIKKLLKKSLQQEKWKRESCFIFKRVFFLFSWLEIFVKHGNISSVLFAYKQVCKLLANNLFNLHLPWIKTNVTKNWQSNFGTLRCGFSRKNKEQRSKWLVKVWCNKVLYRMLSNFFRNTCANI